MLIRTSRLPLAALVLSLGLLALASRHLLADPAAPADKPEAAVPVDDAAPPTVKPAEDKPEKPADDKPAADATPPKNPADPTAQLKRLMPDYDVWIDTKNKHVVMDGEVSLTRGQLEMFACLKGTKEHESVVSIKTKAFVVHAALLALGAKPGSPVKYEPKYTPASGTPVEIMMYWTDDKGQPQKARAQDWLRNVKTKKAMEYPWVFAGSGFFFDEMTKQRIYLGESGDFICVSNFPSAMLDIPVESSQDNEELLFEAFTENVPARGTKVKMVLMPQLDKKPAVPQP